MNKCSSCKTFYEPIQKPNGEYYKCCNRWLLQSKEKIDNIDNTIENIENTNNIIDNIDNTIDNIDNTIDNIDNTIENIEEPIKTNNDIIDEYLNIFKFKNSIIEKLTIDNKNLNNIVNDYKETLSQQQEQQPQQQQTTTKPNINNDRLEKMIKIMMKK
jgi:hypothetical protein